MNNEIQKYTSIDSAIDYLWRLSEELEDEITIYRTKYHTDNKKMLALMEGLQETLRLIMLTDDLHSLGYAAEQEKLKEYMEEMIDAMKNKDSTSMADILEYEITPLVQDWLDAFRKVMKERG